MPEVAEVKITKDFLNCELESQIVSEFVFFSGQYINKDPPGYKQFAKCLPMLVESVETKGKFMYITFYNDDTRYYLLHSMRLTGSWSLEETPYSRWYIELYNGKKIWFEDSRCLATLKFTKDRSEVERYLAKLGPDILSNEFTKAIWSVLIKANWNKNITAFLMDQSIISGCGNYIKAEALYKAGIAPTRKVYSLDEEECVKLFRALRKIPRLVYMGGDISKEKFQMKIYRKDWATKMKTADGRTTYWDPKVQS